MNEEPVEVKHAHVFAPHTSNRYAVVYASHLKDEQRTGYAVVAVHAMAEDGCVLVSEATHPFGKLAFRQPWWVNPTGVIYLVPNASEANTLMHELTAEDLRLEGPR